MPEEIIQEELMFGCPKNVMLKHIEDIKKAGGSIEYFIEQQSKKPKVLPPTYEEKCNALMLLGYRPTGFSGIWSNGDYKIKVGFYDEKTTIETI